MVIKSLLIAETKKMNQTCTGRKSKKEDCFLGDEKAVKPGGVEERSPAINLAVVIIRLHDSWIESTDCMDPKISPVTNAKSGGIGQVHRLNQPN